MSGTNESGLLQVDAFRDMLDKIILTAKNSKLWGIDLQTSPPAVVDIVLLKVGISGQ
jgi:hypothetical protein